MVALWANSSRRSDIDLSLISPRSCLTIAIAFNIQDDMISRFISRTLVLLSLLAAGCNSNSLPNLVPVSGTVLLDGKPMPQGTIGFVPVDPTGEVASSPIVNGKFQMVTTASSRGVVSGAYHIIISSHEPVALPDPSVPFQLDPNNLPPPPKSLIPEKYGNPKTSGLVTTVAPNMPPLLFELESSE